MPDEEPGENVPAEPPQEIRPNETINPPAPPNNPPTQATKPISTEENSREIQNLKDEVRTAEKWMIWLTGAIAFFALCTIGVGLLQWNVMSGQLKEMKSSSGQADKLIDKTRILAENAGKQADRTKELADRMKHQAGQTRVIAEQAKVSAESAKSSAETVGKQLIDFENSQRAILQVDMAWDEPRRGIAFTVRNIGQTSAVDISPSGGGGGAFACNPSVHFSDIGHNVPHSSPSGYVLAAGAVSQREEFVSGIDTKQLTEMVRTRQRCSVFDVNIGYRDVFGNEQRAYGCMIFMAKTIPETRRIAAAQIRTLPKILAPVEEV